MISFIPESFGFLNLMGHGRQKLRSIKGGFESLGGSYLVGSKKERGDCHLCNHAAQDESKQPVLYTQRKQSKKQESQQKTEKASKKSQQVARMTSKTLQQVSKQEVANKKQSTSKGRQARVDKQGSASKRRQARVVKQESASKSRQARVGHTRKSAIKDGNRVVKQESASKSRQARIDKQESISKNEIKAGSRRQKQETRIRSKSRGTGRSKSKKTSDTSCGVESLCGVGSCLPIEMAEDRVEIITDYGVNVGFNLDGSRVRQYGYPY
ncbi:hypothetical protein Tco_1233294 [Tanacetum coccineum]